MTEQCNQLLKENKVASEKRPEKDSKNIFPYLFSVVWR